MLFGDLNLGPEVVEPAVTDGGLPARADRADLPGRQTADTYRLRRRLRASRSWPRPTPRTGVSDHLPVVAEVAVPAI